MEERFLLLPLEGQDTRQIVPRVREIGRRRQDFAQKLFRTGILLFEVVVSRLLSEFSEPSRVIFRRRLADSAL
jgi:hypothetical protein